MFDMIFSNKHHFEHVLIKEFGEEYCIIDNWKEASTIIMFYILHYLYVFFKFLD